MSVRRDVRGYRDCANLRSRAADHAIHAIVEILNLHDRQSGFSGHNNTRMEVSNHTGSPMTPPANICLTNSGTMLSPTAFQTLGRAESFRGRASKRECRFVLTDYMT